MNYLENKPKKELLERFDRLTREMKSLREQVDAKNTQQNVIAAELNRRFELLCENINQEADAAIAEMKHEQDKVTPFGVRDEYGGL